MKHHHRASPYWRLFRSTLLLLLPIVFVQCRGGVVTNNNNNNNNKWLTTTTTTTTSKKKTTVSWMSSLRLRGGDDSTDSSIAVVPRKKYRAIQVQIVHRHGDRTPITPLKYEEFWASTLVSPHVVEKISQGTKLIRRNHDKEAKASEPHKAGGRGPFGKLTQMGLLQMVNVGTQLKEELCSSEDFQQTDANGNLYHGALWGPSRPLQPSDIRILCTDFPRTIQSVQGLLVGFFPDGLLEERSMEIDCRHTSWMIPDPQPRRSQEQLELEMQLASRPYMLEREAKMLPLAIRCTEAVRHLLGEGAFDMAFGIGEDRNNDDSNNDDDPSEETKKILPWAQLAEVTKCLQVRDRLPESITPEDQEALSSHCAWRWCESLRDPRLSYLAMHKFTHTILHSMRHYETEPALVIYSAHDSTLIGLLCAFRLEQPSVWPEYGSYLKMELLEVTTIISDDEEEANAIIDEKKEYCVRFYLNGNLLRSQWHGELREEIPLAKLSHFVSTEGAVKAM